MAKESRFAEVYRQQLKKDKGILGAFASTAEERRKEIFDLRKMLPQSGVIGAISQRVFGKPYRSGTARDKEESARITRMDINSRITARNTSVLPVMAREMNLTRLNVQKLVKLAGGTPSKTSTLKTEKTAKEASVIGKSENNNSSSVGNIFTGISNITGGILNVGGGLLSGIGSLMGSLVGGLGSLVGGMFGGIFRAIGGILSVAGPFGILLMIGAASLMKAIYDNFNFKSLGNLFNNTFDSISKSLKEFFGVDGNSGNKDFLQIIAEKLDSYFQTTKFTDSLNYISEKLKEISNELQFQIKSVYVTITNHAIAAFSSFSDIMVAVGKDIKGIILSWFDNYRVEIFSALGAGAGALGGAKGIAAGAAAGAAIALAQQRIESGGGMDEGTLKNLEEQLIDVKSSKFITEERKKERVTELERKIEEVKKRISERRSKFYSGNVEDLIKNQQDVVNIYQRNLESAQKQNPQPIRLSSPQNKQLTPSTDASKLTKIRRTTEEYRTLSERISKTESAGNYEAMYPNTTLSGATKMTIAEVASKATGAIGKYQNMPEFLISRAKYSGLDPNKDLYSPENQEIIQENLLRENLKLLESAGIEATDENLYWAHRIGAGGVIEAMKIWKKDPRKTLAEIFPKYASKNPDLKGISSSNFMLAGTGMLNNQRISPLSQKSVNPSSEQSTMDDIFSAFSAFFEILTMSIAETNKKLGTIADINAVSAKKSDTAPPSAVNPYQPEMNLEMMALFSTRA